MLFIKQSFNSAYRPFHKTLPKSSLQMHLISVRFYEMNDSKKGVHRGGEGGAPPKFFMGAKPPHPYDETRKLLIYLSWLEIIINARSVQFKIDSLGIKEALWSFGGFAPPPKKMAF